MYELLRSRSAPCEEAGSGDGERISGLGLAASVGLFGGSILVPLKFVPAELSGLPCVPSFGGLKRDLVQNPLATPHQ
eukprot:3900129-Amphidinium_carterae.1